MNMQRNLQSAFMYGMGYGGGAHSFQAGVLNGLYLLAVFCAIDFILSGFKV